MALFVEADKCAKELGVRARGGFFERDEDFCTAIMDGAFQKVIAVRLARHHRINQRVGPGCKNPETGLACRSVPWGSQRVHVSGAIARADSAAA